MKKILVTTLLSLLSINVFAFPEMIRHGYTNCTACHVSPSGGGALNEYGKSLSSEVLSTWSYKGEENILHGLVDTSGVSKWLILGGDFRGLQLHEDTDSEVIGRYIKMQGSLEVGVNQPKWAVVGSVGQFEDQEWKSKITRFYGLYRATDEFTVRAGQFIPAFGVNFAEHILATRGPLGFGFGTEKNTGELSWLGEQWNFVGSYFEDKSDSFMSSNKGFSFSTSYIFKDKNKVGLQYLTEKNDFYKRQIIGATGLLSWSEKLYTLVEADQSFATPITPGSQETKGVYATQRTGYEFFKGFHGLFLNDYVQTDVNLGDTKEYKYGLGMQWFPRPHFDVQLFWTKDQSQENLTKEGDFAWLLLHYYL